MVLYDVTSYDVELYKAQDRICYNVSGMDDGCVVTASSAQTLRNKL